MNRENPGQESWGASGGLSWVREGNDCLSLKLLRHDLDEAYRRDNPIKFPEEFNVTISVAARTAEDVIETVDVTEHKHSPVAHHEVRSALDSGRARRMSRTIEPWMYASVMNSGQQRGASVSTQSGSS